MKATLLIAVSLLLSFSVWAETEVKNNKETTEATSVAVAKSVKSIQLTGSVLDNNNKETLVGATLHVDGKKYYSDLDGNFCIPDIQPGRHQVEVALISYRSAVVEIDTENQKEVKIYLHRN